jgi:hypothetical protein
VGEDLGGNKYLLGASHGCGSLIPAFCRAYIAETGREVVAISACRGDTTIEDWQKGTYRYNTAYGKITRGIAKAKSVGEIEHVYYVWLQGESDAIEGRSKEFYKARIELLNKLLKEELGLEKFGVIRVGRFTMDTRDDEIITAQDEVCAENDDFIMLTRIASDMINQSEYMHPNIHGHFGAAGLEKLGIEAGRTLGESTK